jgi:hypothetical protein
VEKHNAHLCTVYTSVIRSRKTKFADILSLTVLGAAAHSFKEELEDGR